MEYNESSSGTLQLPNIYAAKGGESKEVLRGEHLLVPGLCDGFSFGHDWGQPREILGEGSAPGRPEFLIPAVFLDSSREMPWTDLIFKADDAIVGYC